MNSKNPNEDKNISSKIERKARDVVAKLVHNIPSSTPIYIDFFGPKLMKNHHN
jgi:hypothetical protein